MFSAKEVMNSKDNIYRTGIEKYRDSLKKPILPPMNCYSYDEFKKKSGFDNNKASSIWMDFKLKIQ